MNGELIFQAWFLAALLIAATFAARTARRAARAHGAPVNQLYAELPG